MKRTRQRHVTFAVLLSVATGAAILAISGKPSIRINAAQPDPLNAAYRLRMFHTHTGESIDVVYRRGDNYVPDALAKLNQFLRDHRTGAVHDYDPRLFDLLSALEQRLGRPGAEIDVICGYRSPWSNGFLRRHSLGVAEHSLHMQAEAIDIRIPGVSTLALRNAALALHLGGVGYYPVSGFVHVDVGRVRQWSLGAR